MSTFKDGITFGGSFVIEHQKKETMAAVLLAREGEYTAKINFSQGKFSFRCLVIMRWPFCHFRRKSLCSS